MSSTKIYRFSGYSSPEFVMPVDLAMHTQTNPRVSHLLGISPLRPSALNMPTQELQFSRPSTPSPTSSLSSFSSASLISSYSPPRRGTLRRKKRVVFADDKGLSLTSVRIFNAYHPETETEDTPHPEEKVKVAERPSTQTGKIRVKLGFPQPCPDRASLKENLVQLESCSVTEKTLSGSVRVCNVKFDKTVSVRITFDSWRSHQNIACTYVREPQGSLETDLFAFNIPLPFEMDPAKRVEFLVVFQPGKTGVQLVDNNKGKNYHISVENVTSDFIRFFTPSRRSFVVPSPQRLAVWPVTRSHDLPKAKYQPCKGPPYTQHLLHRSWSMTNLTGLC
ncbi:protein phosphatase 1 regulatory subunit 3C [Triplophysa rosa]|uniref:CBM21 domain-containing protein n=1 Tax=Triplophysa rosa TaxID=992332 RepID=A0A9W7WAQ2_TRIRA|nr:protein phosphatase 1 regulatory subunit 3C [Triplophysa rosa]KAI7793231.1 hypothetical protein IRJ41_009148 [Triplophysa rosa]